MFNTITVWLFCASTVQRLRQCGFSIRLSGYQIDTEKEILALELRLRLSRLSSSILVSLMLRYVMIFWAISNACSKTFPAPLHTNLGRRFLDWRHLWCNESSLEEVMPSCMATKA